MKVKSFVIDVELGGDNFEKGFKTLDHMTHLLGDTIHSVKDSFHTTSLGNLKIVRVVVYSENK